MAVTKNNSDNLPSIVPGHHNVQYALFVGSQATQAPKLRLSCEMILLRNSVHGENIRVCMGVFKIGL